MVDSVSEFTNRMFPLLLCWQTSLDTNGVHVLFICLATTFEIEHITYNCTISNTDMIRTVLSCFFYRKSCYRFQYNIYTRLFDPIMIWSRFGGRTYAGHYCWGCVCEPGSRSTSSPPSSSSSTSHSTASMLLQICSTSATSTGSLPRARSQPQSWITLALPDLGARVGRPQSHKRQVHELIYQGMSKG